MKLQEIYDRQSSPSRVFRIMLKKFENGDFEFSRTSEIENDSTRAYEYYGAIYNDNQSGYIVGEIDVVMKDVRGIRNIKKSILDKTLKVMFDRYDSISDIMDKVMKGDNNNEALYFDNFNINDGYDYEVMKQEDTIKISFTYSASIPNRKDW